jgi:uncharacterized repeat protein (TIGR01451 family)
MVGGTIHDKDVPAANAQFDENAAYTQLDLLNGCTVTYAGAFKELAGSSLVPGVYCATSFHLSGGTLTLTGLASDTWVFKSASDLIITGGAAAKVASPSCNVWWRVVSTASFDAGSSLLGNILADTSITLAANASLGGRALARTAEVTLSSNAITACTPNLAPVAPPTVTKAFSPASITAGGVSRLTITVSNANAAAIALTAALTDTLPSGVLVAPTPNPTTTCGGAVTAAAGGSTVTLATGSTIPAGSCTIAVNVTAATAGSFLNTIPAGALQTNSGNNAAPATAPLAAGPVITLAPATLPNGTVGVLFSQTLTGSGGTAPFSFSVTAGALPAGVTLTPAGTLGLLSGTPTAPGTSTFTIRVTDAGGFFAELPFTMAIATGVPTLPQAFVLLLALGLMAVGYFRLRRRARAE